MATCGSWYVKGRQATQRLYSWKNEHIRQLPTEARDDVEWIRALLAVGLAGPASAARWVPWGDLWEHQSAENHDAVIDVARARGAEWCREFVARAAEVRMGERDLLLHSPSLFRILAALITAHALPVPSGTSFAVGWAHCYDTYSVSDRTRNMREDPLLPDVFNHLLASGFVVKLHAAVDRAIGLVRDGRLDRDRLIAQCVELLTSPQRVSTQRIITKILVGLDVRPEELGAGSALLLNLIDTCDGSVGAVLLPLAIDSVTDKDELVELCTTIAGRTERKQQKDLIAALPSQLAARLGTTAAVAGLEAFRGAAVDDPQLLALVDRALTRLGATTTDPSAPVSRAAGLWQLDPSGEPFVAPRIKLVDDRAVVDRAHARVAHNGPSRQRRPEIDADITPELHLGDLVRRADADGEDAVRRWLAELPWTESARHDPVLEGIYDAHSEPAFESYESCVDRAGVVLWDIHSRRQPPPYALAHWPRAFRYLLARESMLRLGRTPCLLSTPTRGDATIDFDDLLVRVRAAQVGAGFGPLDLLQALLRLRTPEPQRADELAGLNLTVDPLAELPHRRTAVTDAVVTVQEWITAGGVPVLTAEATPYGPAMRTCDLPIAPASFGTLPVEAYRPVRHARRRPGMVGTRHQRLLAPAPLDLHAQRTRPRPAHLSWLLRQMSSDRPDSREEACRTALQIMGERRFDPAAFAANFFEALAAKELRVPRVVALWDLMANAGGLRLLWPAVLTITARAVTQRPLPPGTHELLAWLTRYVAEVPEPKLPVEIVAFARGRGTTKAHYESRALLDVTRTAISA